MRKLLIVIDMQNDFIDGSLGTAEAVAIVDAVREKIRSYPPEDVIATMDTHGADYLETQEVRICVDARCCAGVTPAKHLAALETMRSCQIEVKGVR